MVGTLYPASHQCAIPPDTTAAKNQANTRRGEGRYFLAIAAPAAGEYAVIGANRPVPKDTGTRGS